METEHVINSAVMNEGAPALPIKVMVVDDSAAARGFITNALESAPYIQVIGAACDGETALKHIYRHNPDVVTLDLDMPGMGGLEILPILLTNKPNCHVVVISSMDFEKTPYGMRILDKFDIKFLRKPRVLCDIYSDDSFVSTLVKAVCSSVSYDINADAYSAGEPEFCPPPVAFGLRKPSSNRAEVLAISSSIGGPSALNEVLSNLSRDIDVPICVTQHIGPKFTSSLVEGLNEETGWSCHVARDGDLVQKRHVYVAPGGAHMLVKKKNDKPYIKISDRGPENFCRSSADPMLRSLVDFYGARVLSVVLTGMGQDGCEGCQLVVERGGTVLAQNEQSSVVWGMPGAVSKKGICSAVLPLEDIASKIESLF